MPRATSPSSIQAISRASQIVKLVCERGTVGVLEVGSELVVERTTAHRYLASLEKAGFLARDLKEGRAGRYRLGPMASVISAAVVREGNVVAAARGALQSIADEIGSTIVLGLRTGTTVVVTDVAHATGRVIGFHIAVGHVVPPDGAQSVLALADSPVGVVHSVLDALSSDRRSAVKSMLDDVSAQGVLTATVESASVIAVPLSQNGAVVATLAALLPKTASDDVASAKLLLAWSKRLSGSAE